MQPSMPEAPLARSLIGYGFWRSLRRLMTPEEFEEYVKYWNSRYGTGNLDSESSSENSND
jgi:hypothetical protein